MPRTILFACALVALLWPGTALGGKGWVVKGKGWGHGAGMSQYGAYGFAKHGRGYRKILGHYYRGTRIANVGGEKVRVLVGGGGSVAFSGARRACGVRISRRKGYRFERSGSGVVLAKSGGRRLALCGRSGGARGGSAIRYGGNAYRGTLIARATGGGLNAVNKVRIDDYVKGVIPNEMPSSWPADALRAQAVAARSYALATNVDGAGFDLYDDTRSQVYGGRTSETRSTNRAVEATAGEVLKAGGKIAVTYFFSTSGGKTENVEFAFPGAKPRSYLKGVRDPYDDISPRHRWKERFSRRALESRLSGYVKGRLRRIKVVKTGVSPRIVRARVIGTRGKEAISGLALQGSLGLMSTWARFKRR